MRTKKLLFLIACLLLGNNIFSQVANAGGDQSICNDATQLSGNEPFSATGTWTLTTGNAVFQNQNLYNTMISNLAPGANSLLWTISDGLSSTSDEVVITNNKIANAGADAFSSGNTAVLNAVLPVGSSGYWTVLQGSATVLQISNPTSSVTGLSAGINRFRWTLNYLGCISYDEVTISYGAYAGEDQNVCDTIAFMNATPPPAGSTGIWSLNGGHGDFVDNTLYNTQVNGLFDGFNTFQWTVYYNGSTYSDNVVIKNNRFYVFAGEDQIVSEPNIELNASTSYTGNGSWSLIGGQGIIEDSSSPDSYVSGLQYGYNTFRWTVYNPATGCSDYDDVNIIYRGLDIPAGIDIVICTDTTRMHAIPVTNAVTYWSILQGSAQFDNIYDATTIIRNIGRGENIYRWNITKNGYTTYDDITIYNYQFDTNAGLDKPLCEDNTTLNADGMINYGIPSTFEGQWKVISGNGNFSNSNSQTTSVNNLLNGSNLLEWTVTRTNLIFTYNEVCQAKDTLNLQYFDMPETQFATNPENGKGCSPLEIEFRNTTSVIDTIAGTQYTWSRLNGGWTENHNYNNVFNKTFTNYSNTNDTIYYVNLLASVEIADGVVCRDSVVKPITVYYIPRVAFNPTPLVQYYPSTNVTLTNSSSQNCTYFWDWANGDKRTQDQLVEYFTYDGYDNWGIYPINLTVNNGRCEDSLTIAITILAPEPKRIEADVIKACSPYSHEFTVNDVLFTTPGISEFRWDIYRFEDTETLIEQIEMYNLNDMMVYTFNESGTYFAELWVTGEGSNPAWFPTHVGTDTITVYDIPHANFEIAPLEVMLPNQPIHCYNYSENAATSYWDFGDNTFSSETEPLHYFQETGEYYISLKVISADECEDLMTYDQAVTVNNAGQIVFPNAFTPDINNEGDGRVLNPYDNDIFLPAITEGVAEYNFQIFNRYGVMIFESTDIEIGWTGYYNHKLCDKGAYNYVLTGKYNNGVLFKHIGNIVLLY